MQSSPSQRISHYEILDKLGQGGMGIVYRARDTRLNRLVAIKVLTGANWTEERRRRFIHEARAASALNHPNIIVVHDVGVEDGRDYLVMEHVAGQTLDALIPPAGMKPREAVQIAAQIAAGLSRAHAAGIIHRDLKPSNIMVDEEGLVKVLDFGLAKIIEPSGSQTVATTRTVAALTEEGAIVGTISYMSPEQAEGRRLDVRSDVFSFGSVLHEMLSGHSPFERSSKAATLAAILEREPKPLESVPAELEKLVRRCLRKDPARRGSRWWICVWCWKSCWKAISRRK
jgi:serine/threonine protein kinase